MGKINTTNYPNRPVSSYQDDDMFILQDNGGETYTTNVGDIKTLIDNRVNDSNLVHKTGDETILGNKTFEDDINVEGGITAGTTSTFNDIDLDGSSISGVSTLNVNQIDVHDGQAVEFLTDVLVNGDVTDEDGNVLSNKADKVTNATSGHLAGLDSNGNLTDSGVSPTEDVTVEGNPVTFDSPFEQDAKSVVVSVKPIQDLHGYNHPWPAGGGKNKLPCPTNETKTSNGITVSVNNGVFSVSGLATAGTIILFDLPETISLPSGYFISLLNTFSNNAVNWLFSNENGVSVLEVSCSPTNKVLELTQTYTGIKKIGVYVSNGVNLGTNVNSVSPMLLVSNTDTSPFLPYSNICPISGIDEVEIEVSGKNIFNKDNVLYGYFASNGEIADAVPEAAWRCAYLPIIGGENYTVSGCNENSSTYVCWFNANKDLISNIWGHKNMTYTAPANAVYMGVNAIQMNNLSHDIDTMQVEHGTEATDYEPYNPNSHTTTIPLPSTLYGGEENLTDGSGDSTHELKAISASDDIVFAVLHSGCDLFKLNGVSYKAEGNIISNMFKGDIDFAGAYSAYINSTGNVIFAVPTGLYNASQFKAFLVEQGCTICCELATPTTISFDPADVELLEGTNVVSTNAEKVAVTYGRSLWQDIDDLKTDTEGKLDKSDVATIEGDTASKAYAVNDFMLRSDGFYKVTQPIAQNASITASNTTKTTIGAVLTALLNA